MMSVRVQVRMMIAAAWLASGCGGSGQASAAEDTQSCSDPVTGAEAGTLPNERDAPDAGAEESTCVGLPDGTVCETNKHCAAEQCVDDVCGDGVRSGLEDCDDANDLNTDLCTMGCRAARCGDGYMAPSEECDDANGVNTDACTNDCTFAVCGDGVRSSTEACDDGNSNANDGCSPTCAVEGTGKVCGNGKREGNEACDDGNSVDTDACTNDCKDAVCGDAIVGNGEDCDDGNGVSTDACTNACRVARCGDSIRASHEACDDGNSASDDGCSAVCQKEGNGVVCGNGSVEPGEQCDDGNSLSTDACTNACKLARCGDGIVADTEECDDGNSTARDGCSPACEDECEDCQEHFCRTFVDGVDLVEACFHAEGVASSGPGAGRAKRDLCVAFVDCVHETKCADAAVDACYCGTVAFETCTQNGGNGACKAELEAAAETTDPAALTERTSTLDYVSGAAYNLVVCERDSMCLPLCQ